MAFKVFLGIFLAGLGEIFGWAGGNFWLAGGNFGWSAEILAGRRNFSAKMPNRIFVNFRNV